MLKVIIAVLLVWGLIALIIPIAHSAKMTMRDEMPNQKINTSVCKGKTMCVAGSINKVVDGDAVYIGAYKVRLSLTNTPEKGESDYSEATKFTKSLCIKGSTAIVDQDDKQPFDRYKRLVGKVYCSDKNVNSELLEKGLAKISKKYCKTSEFAIESWATKFGC